MDVRELLNPTRALRRRNPDREPEEWICKVLDAAIRAPSGGNRQPWNFIVIRDAETKRKIGEWYLEAWNATYGRVREAVTSNADRARMFGSADHLANHLAEVPVPLIAAVQAGA